MHRLFVAIRPPRPVRERLLGLAGGVPGARWQDDDQLHLTLRFIGEVDARRADDVALALGAVRVPAFDLRLDGVGRFGRRGGTAKSGVGSLWAGVSPRDEVAALARKVDAVLMRLGLPGDGRAYLPHITVARFGRRSGASPEPWLARWAGLAGPAWTVDSFGLFESVLGGEGASHTLAARYPLGPPANSSARAAAPAETSAQVASKPESGPS